MWAVRMLNTPLARATSMLSRRIVALWRLSPEERKVMWSSVSRRKKIFYGVSIVLSIVTTIFYYEHIEETPVTKRRRFVVLTREQVDAMVTAEREHVLQTMAAKGTLLPDTHEAHRLVQSTVTQLLSRGLSSPDLASLKSDFKVHVYENSSLVSAFCLPSGDLVVFTGLIDACRSREELSFLLAHEMAHRMLGHRAEHLSTWTLVNFFTDFFREVWELAETHANSFQPLRLFQHRVAGILLEYPYSGEMEAEADRVGLTMAAGACFDPTKACGAWTTLKGEEAKGLRTIDYLVLHPCDDRRHGNIASLLPGACAVWRGSGCEGVATEVKRALKGL